MNEENENFGRFRNHILPILSVILITLFPIIFLYLNNIVEGFFKDILPSLIISVLVSIILTFIIGIKTHDLIKSSIWVILISIMFFNYTLIQNIILKVFPSLKYWHILIIILLIIGHVAYFLCKYCSKEILSNINLVVSIFSFALIVLNFIIGVPQIINKIEKSNDIVDKQQVEFENQNINSIEDLPNIYFIIMDEQASDNVLKKYFNYDNSEFYDELSNRGFTISYDSYNESIWTSIITANLLSLDYTITDYTDSPGILDVRKNPALFNLVRQYGYSIAGIDFKRTKDDPNALPIDVMMESNSYSSESLDILLLKNTPLYITVMENGNEEADFIRNAYSFIGEIVCEEPQFGYYHVPGAHSPFVFDANGKINPSYLFSLYDNEEVYLGQFIYCQKLVLEAIDKILENDKDSIIILQSDHSARFGLSKAIWEERQIDEHDIKNIMNAVYYRGEKIDEIKGKSGVNTLRTVFNKLFGTNFDMLDVPNVEVPLNE